MPAWLTKLIGSGVVASLLIAMLQWAWARAEDSGYAKAQVLWEKRVADAERANLQLQARIEGRTIAALDSYIRGQTELRPIEAASHKTVMIYAQTPAGRAPCLAPDRVHGIEGLAATLGLAGDTDTAGPAGNGADALRPD